MGGRSDADDADSDENDIRRRSVLKAAGTAAGIGGLGAAGAQPASAGDDPGTLLELQNCATVFSSAPEDFPIVDITTDPTTEANLPDDPEEVVFYYVGWNSSGQISYDQAYTLQRTLRANGYDHPVVTIQWAADTDQFSTGVENADWDGRRFADYLRGYSDRNPDTTIHLTGLSLGGRPPLATLDELAGDVAIANVAIFGASAPDEVVCGDASDPFSADAFEATADAVYNYHSLEDDTICDLYDSGSTDDGLGCIGLDCGLFDGFPPDNWVDRDVTDRIGSHCDYQVPEVGVGAQIAADLQS